MRAMVLAGIAPIESAPLRWMEIPAPEPGPGEVRLRVGCCAVCRTDLHVVEGELPAHRLPLVPGHQIVGTVDRAGAGCVRFRTGQRAGVAWLRATCGACRHCGRGQENLCTAARFTGYDADGGYAEYAVVREDFAYALPEGFDDAAAAPLLCAGIVGYRALERARVPQGGRLGLVGFGSSAHVVLQLAHHRGMRTYVVTRGQSRREQARRLGATWCGAALTDVPEKLDGVILFAPDGGLVPSALEVLDRGGTLAIAGVYLSPLPALGYERHLFFERDVRTVTAATREDGRALLEEAARAGVRIETTRYALSDANRALGDLKAGRITGTAVLDCG